jgi:hypothetical protein
LQLPWLHQQPWRGRRLQRLLLLHRIRQLALLRVELLHLELPICCELLLERIALANVGIDALHLQLLPLLHELLLFELLLLHALAQLKLIELLRIRRRHATRRAQTLPLVQLELVLQLLLLQPVSGLKPGCSERGLRNDER